MKKQADLDPRLSIGLPHPAYFPYDTTKIKFFIPTWGAQCIATFFCMTSYAAFDSFMSAMLLHICGQLELVGLSFKELVNNHSNNSELEKKFGNIVQTHDKLNR
nr:olfactory receptor 151 [Aulacocentrum confusum]